MTELTRINKYFNHQLFFNAILIQPALTQGVKAKKNNKIPPKMNS